MTGEELYNLWLLEKSNCSAEPWDEIDERDQVAFNSMAVSITAAEQRAVDFAVDALKRNFKAY